MTVTMAQIDAARGRVMDVLDVIRSVPGDAGIFEAALLVETEESLRALLAKRRAEVERLLREWWAQGCREAIVAVPVRHVRHDDGTQSILMSDGVRFHSRDGGGTWYAAEGGSDA